MTLLHMDEDVADTDACRATFPSCEYRTYKVKEINTSCLRGRARACVCVREREREREREGLEEGRG